MESTSILFFDKLCVSDSSCRISTVSEFFFHHCIFCISPICLIPPVESSGRTARNYTLKCSVAARPIFSFSFLLYRLSDLQTSHGHLVASFYSFRFGALVSSAASPLLFGLSSGDRRWGLPLTTWLVTFTHAAVWLVNLAIDSLTPFWIHLGDGGHLSIFHFVWMWFVSFPHIFPFIPTCGCR